MEAETEMDLVEEGKGRVGQVSRGNLVKPVGQKEREIEQLGKGSDGGSGRKQMAKQGSE